MWFGKAFLKRGLTEAKQSARERASTTRWQVPGGQSEGKILEGLLSVGTNVGIRQSDNRMVGRTESRMAQLCGVNGAI